MSQCQVGCYCRPWNQFTLEEFLAGASGAGYDCVGFMRLQGDLVVRPGLTDQEAAALKAVFEAHAVRPTVAIVGHSLGEGIEAATTEAHEFIDAMALTGCTHYLSCGISDESQYDALYSVLRAAAEYGASRGVKVTLKPHGGISATNRDLICAVERVDHPNFSINFDPGNILYYTGGDPLEDLAELAPHVSAMCLKDEAGGEKGDVNIEPGTGDVDFPAVFGVLLDAGFSGPVCVECLGGEDIDDINQRAARVRQRIDTWLGA